MTGPRCPYCPERVAGDVIEHVVYVDASDRTESIVSTHACSRCHVAFRYTPGVVGPTLAAESMRSMLEAVKSLAASLPEAPAPKEEACPRS